MTDAPRRMIEDMTVRKLAARTQESYIRAVKNFSASSGPRGTRRAPRICAATGCIWSQAAPACRPSTTACRRCGFSSSQRGVVGAVLDRARCLCSRPHRVRAPPDRRAGGDSPATPGQAPGGEAVTLLRAARSAGQVLLALPLAIVPTPRRRCLTRRRDSCALDLHAILWDRISCSAADFDRCIAGANR
jgi:hypothetical protein